MKNFTLLTLFAILILMTSCSKSKHLTADYQKYAKGHRTIAVLPYDIQMKGRKVLEMEPEEIDRLRLLEAKLFQQSLYSEVLRYSGRDKKDIKISVQDINKTNRLLKSAGIDILDITNYAPKEIGEVLNVDAIVSTRLIKEMFLSRDESMLLEVGSQIILDKLPVNLYKLKNPKLTRTSEVDIYCTIVDTEAESAIWAINSECDLRWDCDPDDAIESINHRITKKFPYREQ